MYLRCMTHLEPKRWNAWLSLAKWWYYTIYHTSIQMSPFETLYGMKHPQVVLGPYTHSRVAIVKDHLKDGQKMDELLKKNLEETQNRMKVYADQRRYEGIFQVGDWVYLRLQPYKQNSV